MTTSPRLFANLPDQLDAQKHRGGPRGGGRPRDDAAAILASWAPEGPGRVAPRFPHAWVVVHITTSHPSISAPPLANGGRGRLSADCTVGEGKMHSDAMACEQSGHVAAENIQEPVSALLLGDALSSALLHSDCGWKSLGLCLHSTGPVCASQRAICACMSTRSVVHAEEPIQCLCFSQV